MNTFPLTNLQKALARAKQSPLYAGINQGLGCQEDWKRLPLTGKSDLRAAYPFGLLAVPMKELSTYHESSGTSGQVIASYFTKRDWEDVASRFLRSQVALTPDDMVLIKTPYSMVTTAHQMHAAAQSVGATIVPADNRSSNMPYARVMRLLQDLPITVTWSLPTEVLIWGYLARKMGLDPSHDFPNIRAFVVAGEALSVAKRARLSQIWGGKAVIEDYGSTETGSLAGECKVGNLHLWNDRVHCEVLRDGRAFSEGEGTLVVTPLHREAMPLIRYNMEDQVRISNAGCQCGSSAPQVEVLGRASSLLGNSYFPRDLENIVYSMEFDVWFWRARVLADRLEVEIHAEQPDVVALERAIQSRLGTQVVVKNVEAESFVPSHWLAGEEMMQKPRYVFTANEDWQRPMAYA
jgi:phenylacetate-CoA ligase